MDRAKAGRVVEDFRQVEDRVIEEVEKLKTQLELMAFMRQRDHLA
jgi:hypothetical protein